MIESVFILSPSGEVLVEKHYCGLQERTICDKFWDAVASAKDPIDVPPVITTGKWFLFHVQHNGVFILAATQSETPPLLVLEFLNRFVDVLHQYSKEINEDTIREKFLVIYQILDEMLDGGFPFTTEPNIITAMINKNNILADLMDSIPIPGTLQLPMPVNLTGQITMGSTSIHLSSPSSVNARLPIGTSTNTPWRTVGVRYTTNEIYFDILEEIDCIIERNGRVVKCDTWGQIQSNSHLSGMPDLSMTFHNSRILDDVSFHPCVRISRWEQNHLVSFIPPDGSFKLMSYRVSGGNTELPLDIRPQISFSSTGGRVTINVNPKSTIRSTISDVKITIPFSKLISSTNLTATWGDVVYDEIEKVCLWKIGKMPKDKSPILSGNVSIAPGTPVPTCNPVLEVQFKITQYAASGLKIDSLAVTGEKYKPYKGVKSVTQAGNFQVRS